MVGKDRGNLLDPKEAQLNEGPSEGGGRSFAVQGRCWGGSRRSGLLTPP